MIIADVLQDDDDGNPDALVIYISLDVDTAGSYTVSADLYGGTTLISHSAGQGDLTQGVQNVFLAFDFDDIRASNLDGPYFVTSVSITSTDPGGGTFTFNINYKTRAYKYNENFGSGSQPNLVPQTTKNSIPGILGILTGIFVLLISFSVIGLFGFLLIRRKFN